MTGKLEGAGVRVEVAPAAATELAERILSRAGCPDDIARIVARHLVDADLCGVESHGLIRTLNYTEQFESRYMRTDARARLSKAGQRPEIDGGGGIGIPAMRLAVEVGVDSARRHGVAVLPVRNVGHTGRLGAFAEQAADAHCLALIVGGGGRQNWRQVAPYGGRKALLPTNPYCMGIPGGKRGPVVIDFATSAIAGGWLYSARAAGGLVPEGSIIDSEGRPTRNPDDYFAGGAILSKGGPMGYGMALMAEMICEAMLGPVTTESNWLTVFIDADHYRERGEHHAVAEEILSEVRACPPAAGHARVEIPGERERARRETALASGLFYPRRSIEKVVALAGRLGARVPDSFRNADA